MILMKFLLLFLFAFGSIAFAQVIPPVEVSSGIIDVQGPESRSVVEVSKDNLDPTKLKDRVESAAASGANVIVTTGDTENYSKVENLNQNKVMAFLSKASGKLKEKVVEPIKQDKTQFTILTMITGYEIYIWFADNSINMPAAWGQTFLSLVWYFSFGLDKKSWTNLRTGLADYVFEKTSGVFTSSNFKKYLNFLTNLGLMATWISFRMGVFSAFGNSDFYMGKGDFTSLQILAKAGLISGLVAIAHSLSNVFLDNWYRHIQDRFEVKTKAGELITSAENNLKGSVNRIVEFKTLHLGLVLTASGLVNPDIHGYAAWSWTVAYAFAGSLIYYYRDHLDNILTYTVGEKVMHKISQIKFYNFKSGSMRCSAIFN
jgi:hypothetical protein